jgi:hypothetical protein
VCRIVGQLLVLLSVLVATGCSEDSQAPSSFSADDAERIASVRPTTPNWTWPTHPVSPSSCTGEGLGVDGGRDPLFTELLRKFADTDYSCGTGIKWRDDDKLASLSVMRFTSAAGAHKGMAAFRTFAHGWGENGGEVIADEEIEGLGDEATRLRASGYGVQVTYLWRRTNLFLQVHVHCFGTCPTNVDARTRPWVDAVDEEAENSG